MEARQTDRTLCTWGSIKNVPSQAENTTLVALIKPKSLKKQTKQSGYRPKGLPTVFYRVASLWLKSSSYKHPLPCWWISGSQNVYNRAEGILPFHSCYHLCGWGCSWGCRIKGPKEVFRLGRASEAAERVSEAAKRALKLEDLRGISSGLRCS